MNAVVKHTPPPASAPDAPQSSGAALYRVSTDAAALCREIVLATSSNIQGRKYVAVEGWQAVALAHGCAASSGDVVRHEDGSISATGRVVRIDTGTLIASAEGYVGADETTWFGGVVTDKWGKTKTLPKRPDYAIRAMAQTRAISRACRSAFAHVVVMMNAGLSTTPAEEVPENGFDDTPQVRQPRAAPATIDAAPLPPQPDAPKPSRLTFRDQVRGLCAAATTLAEIEEIEGRADFSNAVHKAAPEIADELRSIVAEARARLAVPRKRTITEWLDALEKELVEAATAEAVDEITARSDVQKALDRLTNGARDRLNAMCKAALARTADVGPDGDLGGVE